jgi:hypothetical protein
MRSFELRLPADALLGMGILLVAISPWSDPRLLVDGLLLAACGLTYRLTEDAICALVDHAQQRAFWQLGHLCLWIGVCLWILWTRP